jgi:hypothetical protein
LLEVLLEAVLIALVMLEVEVGALVVCLLDMRV